MLTVIVGFDRSGKSTTRRPFASRYSVIPSTEVTRSTPGGSASAPAGGGASAAWAVRLIRKQKTSKNDFSDSFTVYGIPLSSPLTPSQRGSATGHDSKQQRRRRPLPR